MKESPGAGGHWTIHDIARETGVSAKTVSRVLNHKGGVGPEMRGRILQLMEEVGYQPHVGARSMRSKQNVCIGVTLPAPPDEVPLSQGFLTWLFSIVYETFGSKGEYVAFDLNPHSTGDEFDYGRGIWQQLFKACIVAGPLKIGDPVIGRIHKSQIPYLSLGRLESLPDCSSATVDYEMGARISTEFLINRGHKRIAMLGGFWGFQPGIERQRGYRIALEAAGLPVDPAIETFAGFGARAVTEAMHMLLTDPTVTAIVACSGSEYGVSLREGARRAGRTIGDDLELVAWTYANEVGILAEAAAHVWMPVREVAHEGVQELAKWLMGSREGPIQILRPPVLDTEPKAFEVPPPQRLFEM